MPWSLSRDIRPTVAEHTLLNLAGRRLGPFSNELEAVRHFEVGEVCAAEQTQRFGRGFGTGFENDEGLRGSASFFVRQTDDSGFLDGGMTQQHSCDFDGGDVFTAADDVLPEVADFDVAIGMDDGSIATVKLTVADGFLRRGNVVIVAAHHGVAANDELAHGCVVFRDFVVFVIDDADLGIGEVLDAMARLDHGADGWIYSSRSA